jgi:ferritin-like metal-binding protein YciE
MSTVKAAMDAYLTGLRNQHAVEMQAVGTLQNEMPRMEAYPDLYAKMKTDHERSVTQAARLDDLLEKHGTSKSVIKQAVTGAVATVAGFILKVLRTR